MEKNDTDIFESNVQINNSSQHISGFSGEENPFLNMYKKRENFRHLNDYDSNILKDGAYKDISDDVFKLEYKISKYEEEIKNIESQINAAQEINDINKISELKNKLSVLNEDYKETLSIYKESVLSAKITGTLSGIVSKKLVKNNIITRLKNFCSSLADKMPEKFMSVFKIKKSLLTLENINKSVDELVTMTIPYGENADKYQKLSKYIIKANALQSEISGYLNNK